MRHATWKLGQQLFNMHTLTARRVRQRQWHQSSTINRERATNVVLVVFLFYHANNVRKEYLLCFCCFVRRINDIVSVWIIRDSRTRLTRQYRHLVHRIYNNFIVLHIFSYYSLEYIYIFHSKIIYLYDIYTSRT